MPQTPPESLIAQLNEAHSGSRDLSGLCSHAALLTEHRDSGLRFLQQLRRGALQLRLISGSLLEGRQAALRVQLLSQGGEERGDPLFLLVSGAGFYAWTLEAPTRSAVHAQLYVEGGLPALLAWDALPKSEELWSLGESLLSTSFAVDAPPVLMELGAMLQAGHEVEIRSTVVLESLGCGAVEYTISVGDRSNVWTLYLSRSPEGAWQPRQADWMSRIFTLLSLSAHQ